ncbi:MAG: DUF559 domain-containing protein [Chloroflexi bacterium]|nr:MAG: DUF559 domain-containing protein [Chloroflexota bacterium]
MPRRPVVPVELTAGPFTLADARRAGLDRWHLEGATWRRTGPGTYVWAALAESPTLTLNAASLRLPPSAAFSGSTAAWLHGIDIEPCDPVEVTIPKGSGASALSGLVVRRAALPESDIAVVRHLRATSINRTLRDLSSRLSLTEAVVVIDAALHSRIADPTALETYASARSHRGGVLNLRRATHLAEPLAESPMESRLRMLLVLGGLPRPQAQVSLVDRRGRFLARPDLYYPDHRLALEYDGGNHRDRLVEDNRRQNLLISAGYRLLRFTAGDIRSRPEVVEAQVRAALAMSGGGVRRAARRLLGFQLTAMSS